MSYIPIQPLPRDTHGKVRISGAKSVFDSYLSYSNQSDLWDEQEVSGSGTSTTHSNDRASVRMSVSATTAGKRVRQTFVRFGQSPSSSYRVTFSVILGAGASGITSEAGVLDDENGLFFRLSGTTLSVVRRSYVSGAAVDEVVNQSSWSEDPLDGTGKSGITLDTSKILNFDLSYNWGAGVASMGVLIDGERIEAHRFKHSNVLDSVFMSTPSLPFRFSIENDGTGASSSLECLSVSVYTEGNESNTKRSFYVSTGGTHFDAAVADTLYAIIGLKYQSGKEGVPIDLMGMSIINQLDQDFEWILLYNPTSIAGTFSYSNYSGSALQTAVASGAAGTTVTGGVHIVGGFGKSGKENGEIIERLNEGIRMGSTISGTSDEFVLCVRPLVNNQDFEASVTWDELL